MQEQVSLYVIVSKIWVASFCILFRNTDKFPFKWTVIIIVILAIVLMLPFNEWNNDNFTYFVVTKTWQSVIQGAIPCTSLLLLNVAVYKRLKLLRASEAFKQADEALKKSILRARLSMWIAIIFVISQCIVWLRLPYDVRYLLFFRKLILKWCQPITDYLLGTKTERIEIWRWSKNYDCYWNNV